MPPVPCDFTFTFHARQRERFRDGALVREWRQRYPSLFDEDDERVLRTEQQRQYHFFEWLSAVLLFESTGYLSLVEKYTAKSHVLKREKLRELVAPRVFTWLTSNEVGQPDLFVFEPSRRDWYFCEVKGGADQLRPNQLDWMSRLVTMLAGAGIPHEGKVRVLCLREVGA